MPEKLPSRFLRLPRLKIKPQEIWDLFEELNAVKKDEGEVDDWFTVMAMILICRHSKSPDRAHCIVERVQCLKPMMDDERMRGWTIQTREPGCTWTHSSIFAAVAKCPIRWGKEDWYFNPDEFFAVALVKRDGEKKGGVN